MSHKDLTRSMSDRTVGHYESADAPPALIGRYRVERLLGQGGFGQVYLAHDELLDRLVAVKVPHRDLLSHAAAYLAEARDVARLDHAGIVPVYDVGTSDDIPCFIVSKYIDGTDLATRLKRSPLPLVDAIELTAKVAEAVHAAHIRGLVHRDVKPGNILLDCEGQPFVTDFGVALRESEVGTGPRYAGTPAYMSPEQARGEGHRVDGRSDIFSLGVVFYELLTNHRPFKAETNEALLEMVVGVDPRPPRQINDAIPPHVERVCLKALAKRTGDRYSTAHEFAADLRAALCELMAAPPADAGPRPAAPVVPKGLRSFDADDAEFFLDLLPGPRDRHGLPDAIRFWKTRIEQTDAEQAFHVGLLYGPSGCGKSSLVKAGLLPRLASHVTTIYLEATADLEGRLLNRLARACPPVARITSLPRAFAAVRRGEAGRMSGKILIVIDQFEQWLHARRDEAETDLVRALRQCDGDRLQCLILVRDDFWMMAARFMQDLEIPVADGVNAASVDLFPAAHARAVLTAFGQAYRALPARPADFTPAQNTFLDSAVAGLAPDGWVVPVRLALFAEMVKCRDWSGDVLRELGGTVGIGVKFLDEAFTATTAPLEHRFHLRAVRAVLAELLPSSGTNIRGAAKSRFELMAAADYLLAPMAFDDLMRVLIRETRLLTPTAAEADAPPVNAIDQRYQLTHDYLVPAIREWLARQQQGTRRGRAELRLAERAALWSAKPEARQLPSLTEWLAIRVRTAASRWTPSQQQMMRAATRRHFLGLSRLAIATGLIALAVVFVLGRLSDERTAARSEDTVRRLLEANITEAPRVVDELAPYRRWADPHLERIATDPAARPDHQLRARLALLPADPRQLADLRDAMLRPDADAAEVVVIRDALAPHAAEVVGDLWKRYDDAAGDPKVRFHAAAALAAFDSDNPRWKEAGRWVADQLVAQPSLVLPRWVAAFRPVKDVLVPPLLAALQKPTASAGVVAEVLGDYAGDRAVVLAEALASSPGHCFPTLFARLQKRPAEAVAALTAIEAQPLPTDGPLTTAVAQRHAHAALALLRLGFPERVWPLLKNSPDPLIRSLLIDRFAVAECDPTVLLARLDDEPDEGVRAALWLALGGFSERALPPAMRAKLEPQLRALYQQDRSAAVHAAVTWLLGTWKIPNVPPAGPWSERTADKGWYVTKFGQTMVNLPGPTTVMMSNGQNQMSGTDPERLYPIPITRAFEVAMTEVTVGLFQEFLKHQYPDKKQNHYVWKEMKNLDAPAVQVTWYQAAHFCNWASAREGLPPDQWCYRPNANGAYGPDMEIKADYHTLRGFRLPTEAEWECACRGGATTKLCYGEPGTLIDHYAWHTNNATGVQPVGKLLPNALGFFDVHGNANEWCQNKPCPYDSPDLTSAGGEVVTDRDYRTNRGGGCHQNAKVFASSWRFKDHPDYAFAGGFRIARGAVR